MRSERRESNRLELWRGISEQLLHEWQSQGLVIWTWENRGGAGGEETAAAAAEPLCSAVCAAGQPSLLLLCGERKKKVWECSLSSVRARKYWHYLAAGASNPPLYLAHFGPRFDDGMKGCWWSWKDRVRHVKEGRDGSREEGRDEGTGWRGRGKGKWIPDGLFLVLTKGFARATRPYCCSSDGASSTHTLYRLVQEHWFPKIGKLRFCLYSFNYFLFSFKE